MNFTYKISVWKFLKNYIKFLIFKKITKRGLDLFFRNKDMITAYPATSGRYDEHLNFFLAHFSKEEYKDFLIDIGANIGLVSCQNGENFQEIHMFEPNPDCFKILEVNSMIALKNTNYFLNNFGLGEEDGTFELSVPKDNWGGGYINDDSNPMFHKVSLEKNKRKPIKENTYFHRHVKLKNAQKELENLFNSLGKKKLTKGIIKIDVEGLENPIIKAIAKKTPSNFKLILIFETWNKKTDLNSLISDFGGRAKIFEFTENTLWEKKDGKILKLFSLLGFLFGKPAITYKTKEIDKEETNIDYIITVSEK